VLSSRKRKKHEDVEGERNDEKGKKETEIGKLRAEATTSSWFVPLVSIEKRNGGITARFMLPRRRSDEGRHNDATSNVTPGAVARVKACV
jgi:hypothetical protein